MPILTEQTLSNYLAQYTSATGKMPSEDTIREHFSLPAPLIEQTMVITLHIPVTNLDPKGETVRTGQNMLCEIVAKRGDSGLAKLISFIKSVDIEPRVNYVADAAEAAARAHADSVLTT